MAAPDIYNVPTMQQHDNNPGPPKSDVCYAPSAPMQAGPPPSYQTPAPPPYAIPPPPGQPQVYPSVQSPMYQTPPVFVTHMQMPYQGVVVTGSFMPPQTVHINDYMIWSIINVFLGGCLLGMIAVLLSSQTRKRKMSGDVAGATSMSKMTLICNILITLIFFGLTAFIIVYYVTTLSVLTSHY